VGERPPEESPDLLGRLRRGEPGAFEDLVIAHQHRVYGLALRMLGRPAEAEDVAQEVFFRAHRGLAGFRGDARLSTWLHTICSRLCLTRLAERRQRGDPDDTALATLADGRAGPEEHAARGELATALQAALDRLDPERRLVVLLRDVEGLAYEEIAAALDLPVGTVRSRLSRARAELRERLDAFVR
jgi:RNA polymerase sigma-70 factor (ECF subfamily)